MTPNPETKSTPTPPLRSLLDAGLQPSPAPGRCANDSRFAQTKAMLAETAAETEELNRAAGGSVTDVAADWIAAEYLAAVRQQLTPDLPAPDRVKLLRQAARDIVALQRGGHSAARLRLDREKLEWEKEKHRLATVAAEAESQKRDPNAPLSDEERRAIVCKIDDIMGLRHLDP